MSEPRIGMHFEDVRQRVKRISKVQSPQALNLMNSLRNQARLAEGEGAVQEIDKEIMFSGNSNRQSGFGEGKRLGQGRWRYESGAWVKIE